MKTISKTATLAALAVLLLAPMASAQPNTPIAEVPAGLDLWQTLGSGATGYDFAGDPLPADFFCAGSKAFTGRIDFEGVPMGGALGSTDTIIERLGTAVFDADGVGTTRIRPAALNLVGSQKIATPCGEWSVRADLARHQPVSEMTLYRENKLGGVFDAELRINVRLTFENGSTGVRHQLSRTMYLPTYESTPYTCVKTTSASGATSGLLAARAAAVAEFEAARVGHRGAMGTKAGSKDKPEKIPGASDDCIVGYECSEDGKDCIYVYSWHEPQADERHFTHTPCELKYEQFCREDSEVDASLREQLEILDGLGYLTRPAAEVLTRQTRIRN